MPYTAPPTWQHGDFPTAPPFNAIKDSLDAMHAQTGDAHINGAVCRRMATVQGYYFVHKHTYLIYLITSPENDGFIEDPEGIEEDVSLPVTGDWTYYDLGSVEWLFPGKIYQVEGVSCCFEDTVSL